MPTCALAQIMAVEGHDEAGGSEAEVQEAGGAEARESGTTLEGLRGMTPAAPDTEEGEVVEKVAAEGQGGVDAMTPKSTCRRSWRMPCGT
mmetsp:Transcript_16016/g.36705  ORF Transcript_16016/g.36705 Transcript_16016/m.36705 type:complete len:90 (+) Transcript_16016:419-688(+)